MKKLIFSTALSIMSCVVFAQNGALTVTNNNANCGVWVKMAAVDAGFGNGSGCDITGITFYLTAGGGSWAFSNPGDFDATAGGPGYASFTTFMSFTDLSTTTTFQWTDVSFQWDCPIPPCLTNNGGVMADPIASALGLNCLTGNPVWSGGTSCLSGLSTWTNATLAGPMDDIVIDFN